jgi:protein involved in polysaccharide export with SLBB domain
MWRQLFLAGHARMLRCVSFGVAFALAGVLLLGRGEAQQSLNLTPEQIQQQLQQVQNGGFGGGSNSGVQNGAGPQGPIILQPAVPPQINYELQPSRLEQIMSARAGVFLKQFGYDQVGRPTAVSVPQTGAVQDDYVLGPGDELVVVLRGQENSESRTMVDRNGQVTLPRLGPISASGRSFGSFRQDVQAAVHRAYVATDASVSVARMRQISVLVTGSVNYPGQRLVTGLSSVLDAILISGGIAKTGSLRDVRLVRGGRQYNVDLYSIITGNGAHAGMRLADGDRIFVAPLGRTVAASGLVRNPGIYELPPGQSSISVQALIALAGGREVNGNYLTSILKLQPNGSASLVQVKGAAESLSDGDVLVLQLQADQTSSRASLSGGIGLAGNYPLAAGTKLSEIIRLPGALGTSPYTLMGLIARRDPKTLLRSLIAFTPSAVLNGGEDIVLQSDDIIRVISMNEMHMMVSAVHDYDTMRMARDEALRNPASLDNVRAAQDSTSFDQGAIRTLANRQSNAVDGLGQGAQYGTMPNTNNTGIAGTGNQMDARLNAGFANQSPQNSNLSGQNFSDQSSLRQDPYSQNFSDQGASNRNLPNQNLPNQNLPNLNLPNQNQPAQNFQNRDFRSPALNFQDQATQQGTYAQNREATTIAQLGQQLSITPLILINFLLDHTVTIDGAVRGAGTYFSGPSTTLQDLVQVAGGTMSLADVSGVEVISTATDPQGGRSVSQVRKLSFATPAALASYVVQPRDAFRFNEVFTDVNVGSATIQGEVRFNGSYKLRRGEHLSDLLARAGGLTSVAYPYGTVFLRKSAAALEKEGYQRTAREVEDQLMAAMTRVGSSKIDPSTFSAMQNFVADLRTQRALGRIAISADPSVLAANPALDPLLEPDDVIYIPQRPSTISVLGQVMQAGSFPYVAGATVDDYLARAGGYSGLADQGDVYIVLPDGTARRLEKSWLRFGATANLPPGSAIVVPRDVTPLDLRQTIIDVSQILSQLAISIASVAVISK